MHSDGIFVGPPHPKQPGVAASDPCGFDSEARLPQRKSRRFTFQVLSVGRLENQAIMREALTEWSNFQFSHASDYRELWSLSRERHVDAAVFHNSLCSFELEEAARLVRSRWPKAKILIVRSGEVTLEDPLYDHRVSPPIDPRTLISVLSELTGSSKDGSRQHD